MKICYLDESGTGDEPIAVVAGIIVDTQRMHITKNDWAALLDTLSQIVGTRLSELHTKDFYRGNAPFRGMDGRKRSAYISAIISWFAERKHGFVFSGVRKNLLAEARAAGRIPAELTGPWIAAAFHLVLSIQRAHQRHEKTKGHTLLIFDNKDPEKEPFTQLILNPPDWSDEYYSRNVKKEPKLSEIVDAPYFADSKHVALIQVADFLAYFLRRYAELAEKLVPEKYPDEESKIGGWIKQIADRCIASTHIYPSKGRCYAANIFYEICPPSLRGLRADKQFQRTALTLRARTAAELRR